MSVQQLSIERIAREAGVSKTTIYRWWPDKAAVIIDTFLENHILLTSMREDLPPLEALREHVVALAAVYAGHEGRLMAQLLAESIVGDMLGGATPDDDVCLSVLRAEADGA